MQLPRFFVPELPQAGQVQLDENESRHASSVLRLTVGDEAMLFDGQGNEALVEFASVSRNAVLSTIRSWTNVSRELPGRLTLAVALPKGDRQRVLVDGLTELGVTRLQPLITKRGVAQPTEGALSRLRRAVVETSKQCTRTRLMDIAEPQRVTELVSTCPSSAENSNVLRCVAHPYTVEHSPNASSATVHSAAVHLVPVALASLLNQPYSDVTIAIGPEGGFTDEEMVKFAAANWQLVTLGKRILRVEMAAIAAAAQASASLESCTVLEDKMEENPRA